MKREPIRGLGVTLIPLAAGDIELLRTWRNDRRVSDYMVFQGHITVEAQKAWFASIDNDRNFYFLIEYEGEKVGMSHIKNVDYTAQSGECGSFIYPERLRNSLFGYRYSLPGADWAFGKLGLREMFAHITRENRRAVRFNRGLGMVFDPDEPGSPVLKGRLFRESYLRRRPSLYSVFEPGAAPPPLPEG